MNRVHPIKLDPIGYLPNGRPIYPIMGGSGESPESERPSNQKVEDDDDDDDDEDSDDASGAGTDDSSDDKGTDDPTESEAEKLKKRLRASDKNNSKLQARLRELEDKDKSELERAQGAAKDATDKLAAVQSELSNLRLENAFLKTNDIAWQNTATAISVAQSQGFLEGVVDEETGEIDAKALKAALSKLASAHEYLVKKPKQGESGSGASGEPGPEGNSGNHRDEKAKKKKMESRFPVLRSR